MEIDKKEQSREMTKGWSPGQFKNCPLIFLRCDPQAVRAIVHPGLMDTA